MPAAQSKERKADGVKKNKNKKISQGDNNSIMAQALIMQEKKKKGKIQKINGDNSSIMAQALVMQHSPSKLLV